MQETGRAGRDMLPAQAILYHKGFGVVVKDLSDGMKEYCDNKTVCRRKMLIKHFDSELKDITRTSLCLCCDVWEQNCNCESCIDKLL